MSQFLFSYEPGPRHRENNRLLLVYSIISRLASSVTSYLIPRISFSCFSRLIIVGVALAILSPALFPQQKALPPPPLSAEQKKYLNLFTDIFGRLSQGYVDPKKAETEKLIFAAIRGMIEELDDPYSVFFGPEAYKNFTESRQGQYYGIGVHVVEKDDQFEVISVIEESPAWETGIKKGDIITAINNIKVEGRKIDELTALVQGPVNTLLKITLVRNGVSQEYTLKRRAVIVKSLYHALINPPLSGTAPAQSRSVSYIRIHKFVQNTDEQLQRVLDLAKDNQVRGVIIDLRNNPGGFLNTAVNMVDLFISDGTIVSTENRNGISHYERANKSIGFPKFIPVVILVNEYSASASEVFSGALRDHGRAVVIGQQTFGKFSVQQEFPYRQPQQVGFKMTIARYILPGGGSYHKDGIPVAVSVENPASFELNTLEARYDENDAQLTAALKLLSDRDRYQSLLEVTAK